MHKNIKNFLRFHNVSTTSYLWSVDPFFCSRVVCKGSDVAYMCVCVCVCVFVGVAHNQTHQIGKKGVGPSWNRLLRHITRKQCRRVVFCISEDKV